MAQPPRIAILGAGIFVRTEYIPRLAEISHLFTLKAIWSRTEESARGAIEIAEKLFPKVECKWGDAGLDQIILDASIVAVIVVLAAQVQAYLSFLCVDLSLRLLKAGKHVLQAISEVETAFSRYNSFRTTLPRQPIWAIAENFRFEPAFVEGKNLMAHIGSMTNFQIIVEIPINSSSAYFSTPWRHSFTGGYILDIGVHFAAVLRMVSYFPSFRFVMLRLDLQNDETKKLAGCEVTSVSAMTSHLDTALPPPDNMCSVVQLENGCSGVFVTVVSGKTLRMSSRIVGANGTLQIELENRETKSGYSVTLFMADGQLKSDFYPISGVTEELKAFFHHVSQATLKNDNSFEAEPRISFVEGARDVAVLDAMLESGRRQGVPVQVKRL
ncbi:hypothetical protein BUALT_Bualt02G0189300 [Buddleja alternifolia]|uniref:Uncharacterized protein n=1 Tax=Buddleja alternifolia TaxID=168488 RepID=A0AAV6Y3J0_9LAMI|nr:hypothetical protein BUALT_Bualt02G0189300 [Buddleja alternifolia]